MRETEFSAGNPDEKVFLLTRSDGRQLKAYPQFDELGNIIKTSIVIPIGGDIGSVLIPVEGDARDNFEQFDRMLNSVGRFLIELANHHDDPGKFRSYRIPEPEL